MQQGGKVSSVTFGKDVLKTWNNVSSNMSSLKDIYGANRPNFPKCEFAKTKNQLFEKEILLELKPIVPQYLVFPFRPLIYVCTKKNEENVNGIAIVVMFVVER